MTFANWISIVFAVILADLIYGIGSGLFDKVASRLRKKSRTHICGDYEKYPWD